MMFRRSPFALGFAAGCVVALVISTATLVRAETIVLPTRIDAVTVYPRGAQVVRIGRIELPAGTHTLRLSDLPRDALEETFRVEGSSSGQLEIGTVDLKTITLTTGEADAAVAERRAIEVEIERLERDLEKLGYDIAVQETQQEFLKNLASLPSRGPLPMQPANQGSGAAVNWAEIYQLLGTNMTEVQGAIFRLRQTVRDTEEAIDNARKRLARLAPKPERRLVGDITVIAGGEQEAELTVRYQVRSAMWKPIYDARLATSSNDGGASVLELTRRAAISQSSGEPWNDVALSMSTARPQGSTAAPVLEPLIVDFRPEPPPQPEPAAEAIQQTRKLGDTDYAVRSRGFAAAKPQGGGQMSLMAPAVDQEATIEAASFQATFSVPDRTTIADDGTVKQVKIDTQSFEPELIVRTVPRVDPRAYLYAKLKLPGETPYLPGTVTLFRDGTFVGRGSLPSLSGGADHELGFGADDQVQVTFAVAEEIRSETGTFTASRVDQKRYKVGITNHHSRDVTVTVLDRIPVSRDKEITIESQATMQPTTRDVDDKRGILAWTFPLSPKGKKAFEIGYKVSWPAEREIDYR